MQQATIMIRALFLFVFVTIVCAESRTSDPSTAESEFFVQEIFKLYGHNDRMTFEGFEHLMENLGLGGVKFDRKHSLQLHKDSEGRFVELHDQMHLHAHNHSKTVNKTKENSPNTVDELVRKTRSLPPKGKDYCLSTEELLELYGLEPDHGVTISPYAYMRICPAIVYQLDRKACAPRHHVIRNHTHHHKVLTEVSKAGVSAAWIGATVSIVIISAAGLVGVCVVPVLERSVFKNLLSALVALAVGTLCGDALIHLLPHAYGISEDQHAIFRSSSTFFVIVFYFVIESAIHMKSRKKKNSKDDVDYAVVHAETNHGHSHGGSQGITSTAWMVISGDGLHNLTDGLAVGAAFRADLVAGMATAIAVLTHELPHELGDFAILLKSGMTMKQAITYNVVSSVLALAGMIGGVLLGEIESAITWIYCITAGSFLYIALASLIPELHKAQAEGTGQLFLQVCGMMLGGGIMFVIAMYEHSLEDLLTGTGQ